MERKTYKEILHKELSYEIGGLFLRIHDILGRFARELQYSNLFEDLLKEKGIPYKREAILLTAGQFKNKADFIIDNKIIVEFKAKPFVTKEDYYQTQRYLQASNLDLAVIVNFRNKYLSPKRVINYSKNKSTPYEQYKLDTNTTKK